MDKNETLLYETNDWLQDRRHQTVLKTMHTIAYKLYLLSLISILPETMTVAFSHMSW